VWSFLAHGLTCAFWCLILHLSGVDKLLHTCCTKCVHKGPDHDPSHKV
jgi:hypothetical protein